MIWTKRHSQNAVAAKARKRMAQRDPEKPPPVKVRVRRLKAKWTLSVRDEEHGDSFTLKLYRLPWKGRYVGSDHREHSANQLGRMVSVLLTHAA